MGHAGFAVTFLTRTHQYGHVHRDFGLGAVWKDQYAQAIIKLVLGDAFDGGDFFGKIGGEAKLGGGERDDTDYEFFPGHISDCRAERQASSLKWRALGNG